MTVFLTIFRRFPTSSEDFGLEITCCFRCRRSTPFPFGLSLANFMVTQFSSPGDDIHRGYYTMARRYELYTFEWQKQHLTRLLRSLVRWQGLKIRDATAVRRDRKSIFKEVTEVTYFACSRRRPDGIDGITPRRERGFGNFDVLYKTWVYSFQWLSYMMIYSSIHEKLAI